MEYKYSVKDLSSSHHQRSTPPQSTLLHKHPAPTSALHIRTANMMSFTSTLFALALTLATASCASASVLPRQVTSHKGTINAPSLGTTVSSNSTFPFSYADANWCEDGYSPVAIWLTDYEPTTSNLNATGQFPEGSFTHNFGLFTNPNFGKGVSRYQICDERTCSSYHHHFRPQ